MRRKKNLFTKNTEGERIGLYTAYDESDEAAFIAGKSAELIDAGVKPSEIAVLYRANFQSRVLEEAFLGKNLPYQVLGTRFFERKEVKDAISYLRAAMSPESFADWQRISTSPPRGIGKVTLAKVVTGQAGQLTPAVKKKIDELKNLLADIRNKACAGKLSDAIKYAITASGLLGYLQKSGLEGEERAENLKELITFASRYDTEGGETAAEHFLTDVALSSDQDELEEKNEAVRLLTVHSSKGLEFDVVFISGLEEDLFPHKKMSENQVSDSQAEEERRLFYVALTRARKKIYLSYASVRTIFGSRQVNVPSEFIFDIDEEFLMNEERLAGGGKIIYLD
jgi:DNA helicase II / ATP-dependent DNA helicase PcrA